ncbi:YdjY domain-containing protein [Paludisphaera sp.]|uniref:YdjY domain-containing protein n=1 Tax=Paludisphaera sp. TaxID=2017432 RepID=UPI00301DB091
MLHLILSAACLAPLGWRAPADDPADDPAEPAAVFKPDPDWKPLGRSLWLDARSSPRRLILRCRVVFREGPLEHLLCSRGSKEHESILATDAPPTQIHAGLLLTGVEPGGPVRFKPEYKPPHGPPIAAAVRWKDGDEIREADARSWIRDDKTGKQLDIDWVFAGSLLYEDPVTKRTTYAADDGDLITVANFAGSILDLPIISSADDADRFFVAFTERIPPNGTEVQLVLSPRARDKPAAERAPR